MLKARIYKPKVRRFLFVLWVLTAHLSAFAEVPDSVNHYGFRVNASPGGLVNWDHYGRKFIKRRVTASFSVQLDYTPLPVDSDATAADYDYPTFGLGLKYSLNNITFHRSADPDWGKAVPVDYDSHMGNIVTLYGTFQRALMRRGRWMWDYTLGTGIGYSHTKYNPNDNVDNETIGSRWLIYFTAGSHVSYAFAPEWAVSAGIEFYHHSNGALNRPNKGANILGASVALRYQPYYSQVAGARRDRFCTPFKPYLFANVAVGVGAKTLNEDWQKTQFGTSPDSAHYRTGRFHLYATYSMHTSLMYRYARRWASGVGADLFYGSYATHIRHMDEQSGNHLKHSPWSVGLSLKHHAYYHNISARMSLGFYLYRHMGQNAKEVEKPYYENIGLSYAFPRLGHLAVGFNIKAHLAKADYTEILISYPIPF